MSHTNTSVSHKFSIDFFIKESSRGDESSANIADAQVSPGIFTFLIVDVYIWVKLMLFRYLLTYLYTLRYTRLQTERYNQSIQYGSIQNIGTQSQKLKTDRYIRPEQSIDTMI
jgi:hypothetical protein